MAFFKEDAKQVYDSGFMQDEDFDFEKGLNELIRFAKYDEEKIGQKTASGATRRRSLLDDDAHFLIAAGMNWPHFNYKKALEALKTLKSQYWYNLALQVWHKGVEETKEASKKIKSTAKKMPKKPFGLKESVEKFTVHIAQRNGAHISYFGLTEAQALAKIESCYKRRLNAVSRGEDGREAGASFKNDEGKWTWYHENFTKEDSDNITLAIAEANRVLKERLKRKPTAREVYDYLTTRDKKLKEDSGFMFPAHDLGSTAFMSSQHPEQERRKRKGKKPKNPEKIESVEKEAKTFNKELIGQPWKSKLKESLNTDASQNGLFVDAEMNRDLEKGTRASMKRYQKRTKGALKSKKRSMVIPPSDAHTIDIDNQKMESVIEFNRKIKELCEFYDKGEKSTSKGKVSFNFPPNKTKLNEALQMIRFHYQNYKHEPPIKNVKILDVEYPGQVGQKTYGRRRDLLGWDINEYANKEEAVRSIDEIDSFARLLSADNLEKYRRIKVLFPEQAKLIRRYIREYCKGLRIRKDDGLWHLTDFEEIKRLNDESF